MNQGHSDQAVSLESDISWQQLFGLASQNWDNCGPHIAQEYIL
jgi:hypothetical protein